MELPSGRMVVTDVCHLENSDDGDDHIKLMTSDQAIKIVDLYSGPFVSRLGSMRQRDIFTYWKFLFKINISSFIPIRIRSHYFG
jgi:hypothetical protein